MNPRSRWPLRKLGELVDSTELFCDGDWVETKDQDPQGDVRLVQLADVGEGHFRNRSSRYMTSDAATRLRCTYLEPGDVLIARMPDPLGRACLFPGVGMPCVTVVDVAVVRVNGDRVRASWLMHMMNTPQVRAQIADYETGTTRKRISRRNLAKLYLPVPSVDEQDLVLQTTQNLLSRLQSASSQLKAAGRRISNLIESNYANALDTPASWVRLGDVCDTSSGGTPKRSRADFYGGSIPWIKSGELGDTTVLRTEENLTEAGLAASSAKLVPQGTLLVAMYGATIGRLGIVGFDSAATNQAVAALKPAPELDVSYLWIVLRGLRRQLISAGQGGAQPNISQAILRELLIPLPDLSVQRSVVESVHTSVERARRLDDAVALEVQKVAQLRSSILAAAFAGRLTAQEAASV